ncbi:hypothetical protein [Prolixibacter sp. NT017]|uniref:hypothetical protein n=1 Tax=Prolixibacter sp. NT017 TaxID=2652390 RepID=UPI0012832AE1|nr:hypothetical protein [Prolixibacter sp. NT017]GET26021.1 hypothetical protein NT017_23500 [Prolixibacter sp. NT017]
MTINKLFDFLDEWRNLPAYQLERRADIFFAIHLEEIMQKVFGTKIDFIIPEFPVRIGEVYEKEPGINRSFKIDYLAYSRKEKKVFLIELKTDQRSRREKQDWYLKGASKIGVKGLISGLLNIYNATDQKVKYDNLLDKVEGMGWIKRDNGEIANLEVEIEPSIVYIQPLNKKNEESVISFDDIIEALSESKDSVTKRFVESLGKWKSDTNIK